VLIITDILMPKLDGYAFVQKLRLNPETRPIPVETQAPGHPRCPTGCG